MDGPPGGRELFVAFSKVMHGFPFDAALDAGMNVVINALRQQHPNRAKAEAAYDELAARTKAALMVQYDGAGSRRSVIPAAQHVGVAHMDFSKK